MAESENERGSRDRSSDQARKSYLPSITAIGWAFVLLVLAGYFAWMIVEMGAHAVTGGWPMLGVFVAAVVGGVAASIGLMIGRSGRD